MVRHIKFGEGDYTVTERLIRQLLTDADPGVRLPRPSTRPISPPSSTPPPRPTSGSARWSTTPAAGIRRGHRHIQLSAEPARGQLRAERPLVIGLSGRHRPGRQLEHRTQLSRQERLPRRRRHRDGHGDP
ncbi:dipZ domain protein [Mycobacterium xenopi 3993]|nr:dipZ domain protein [Mycobacterium xenopi 3993]